MAKIIKKTKVAESVKAAPSSVETKEEDLFDPLPSTPSSSSVPTYPAKKYVILAGESTKRRVFQHTLHKGTDRERKINFVNLWVQGTSITINNPTIRQLQELQALYTRDRGFNIMKFTKGSTTSYTLYKMRVLSEAELAEAFEE